MEKVNIVFPSQESIDNFLEAMKKIENQPQILLEDKILTHEEAFEEFDKAGTFSKGQSAWEIWNHGVLWADLHQPEKCSDENTVLLIAAHGTIRDLCEVMKRMMSLNGHEQIKAFKEAKLIIEKFT